MALVKYALLLVVGLALGAVWAGSAAANFVHGLQIAGNSPWWLVFGILSAGLDVIKGAGLIGLRIAWRRHAFTAIAACAFVWVIATAWGMSACWGFMSTILSDTVSGRALHGVADTSLKRQIDDQIAQITKFQDAKIKADAKTAERLEAEIGKTEARLERLQARARTAPAVGSPDPASSMLARAVGMSEEAVRIGKVFLFLAAVELCASIGFLAFAPMLEPLLGVHFEEAPKTTIATPPLTPQLLPLTAVTPAMSTLFPDASRPRVSTGPRDQARALLRALETRYGPGTTIATSTVFDIYQRLGDERGWRKMTSLSLGKQLAKLGVEVTEDDVRRYYVMPTEAEQKRRNKGGTKKERRTEA